MYPRLQIVLATCLHPWHFASCHLFIPLSLNSPIPPALTRYLMDFCLEGVSICRNATSLPFSKQNATSSSRIFILKNTLMPRLPPRCPKPQPPRVRARRPPRLLHSRIDNLNFHLGQTSNFALTLFRGASCDRKSRTDKVLRCCRTNTAKRPSGVNRGEMRRRFVAPGRMASWQLVGLVI